MDNKIDIKFEKEVISFETSPTKSGPRYYFNIPIVYIKNQQLNPEKKYKITVYEIDNNSNNHST
jgi:hypothetical protein